MSASDRQPQPRVRANQRWRTAAITGPERLPSAFGTFHAFGSPSRQSQAHRGARILPGTRRARHRQRPGTARRRRALSHPAPALSRGGSERARRPVRADAGPTRSPRRSQNRPHCVRRSRGLRGRSLRVPRATSRASCASWSGWRPRRSRARTAPQVCLWDERRAPPTSRQASPGSCALGRQGCAHRGRPLVGRALPRTRGPCNAPWNALVTLHR